MTPRLPKNIVFQGDFYVAKNQEPFDRLQSALKAKQMGFDSFGAEFLFMHTNDVQNLDMQQKRALQIMKTLKDSFEKTHASIHAPWMPETVEPAAYLTELKKNVSALSNWGSEFADVINVHVGVVSMEHWKKNIHKNWEYKNKLVEMIIDSLEQMQDLEVAVCVETITAPLTQYGLAAFTALLPSDLKRLSKPKKIGLTIDTAHAGLVISACQHMVQTNELVPGFFEEEWSEIRMVAKKQAHAFSDFGKKVGLVHFNSFWSKPGPPYEIFDGSPIGEGDWKKEKLFDWLEILAQQSGKKRLGATLEIKEKNYASFPNFEKTMHVIAEYYGLEH